VSNTSGSPEPLLAFVVAVDGDLFDQAVEVRVGSVEGCHDRIVSLLASGGRTHSRILFAAIDL
jgi:hypothetical protein